MLELFVSFVAMCFASCGVIELLEKIPTRSK